MSLNLLTCICLAVMAFLLIALAIVDWMEGK